jgi:transposase
MSESGVEIIGGRERRRRWSVAEKLRIVAESDEPGASVRAVAARHDVYPSLLHTWRRQMRQGHLTSPGVAPFVPIRLLHPAPQAAAPSPASSERPASEMIEVVLPDGSQVRVGNEINLAALRRVIAALRG